jgi:hypothetical protein
VQSITSVVVSSRGGSGAAILTTSSYRLDTVNGTVTLVDSSVFGPLVTVTYVAGRTTVPPAVRWATLEQIRHMWESQRGGGQIRPLVGLDQDFGTQTAPGYLVPHRVMEALRPYAISTATFA